MENIENKGMIFEKIGRVCLYLLAFLTPLFFLPLTTAPVEINKQILAMVLILTAFICVLIKTLASGKIIYPKSRLSLAVLTVLVVSAISVIFSKSPIAGLYGGFVQQDTFLGFLLGGLLFFSAFALFKEDKFGKILFSFLSGVGVLALLGILNFFGKFPANPMGSIFNWGFFLAFGFVVIIAVLNKSNEDSALPSGFKATLVILGALIGIILFILNYWIIWLGIFLAMAVLISYKLYAKKFAMSSGVFLPMAIMTIALVLLLIGRFLPAIVSLPAEVRLSPSGTFQIAKNVLWSKYAAFGTGPATFGYNYELYKPAELNQTAFWQTRFNQGFSFISSLPAAMGILGALAFLFLIFAFFARLFGQKEKEDNSAFLAVFSGTLFLIIGWFLYPANFAFNVFIFLGLGLIAGLASDEKKIVSLESFNPKIALAVFWAVNILIVFTLALFYLGGQKYAAAVYYGKGLSDYYGKNDLNEALLKINRAVMLDAHSDQYLKGLSQGFVMKTGELISQANSQQQNRDVLLSQIQNTAALAISSAVKAAEISPADSSNYSNLGSVYEGLASVVNGADSFAEDNYKKAIELNPKNPAAYVDLARILTARGKKQEAEDTFKKAIALKPDFAPAYYYLGVIAYQDGKISEAQKNFEQAVILDNNYSNALYFLGLTYSQRGLTDNAVLIFERVAELNPNNAEIGNILNNLREGRAALANVVPPAPAPEERTEPVSSDGKKKIE